MRNFEVDLFRNIKMKQKRKVYDMSVFISYRRDGGKTVAESIYQSLCDEYNIFLDTESLQNGYFDTTIIKHIENCSDFIIIITETVFNRCIEPNDWIFHEAQIALREKKNIIPIFVGIQKFPLNVPEPLKEICRYNGIFWKEKDVTCSKIKTFLVSNRRYKLSVVRSGNQIALNSETKEKLKELYRKFLKNGRNSTDIEICVTDTTELSNLIIRQDVVKEYGIDFAKHLAEQSFLKKTKWIKESLEIAIEYLIQDEMIDSCAIKLEEFYIKKYGVDNCVFKDENGIEFFYWTPFLWFDIIEELLKELLYDRYYVYGNSKDFTEVDCFVETRSGKKIWGFSSFVSKISENDSYTELMNKIDVPGGRGDYMDVPLHSLAFHIYPDLYYNIGMLKANKTMHSFETVNQYKGVFNLWYYYIGLH